MPATADVGGRLLGRYRVVRSVGVGGFARVYHAVDPDLELDVAVKVLRPELTYDTEVVERFRREATTAAKLRHPHVITVLTVGRLTEPFDGIPAGAPYLVMDYLPHSLADRVSAGGALAEADVARIGAEVARGLAYAHRQGIVHRDVKPENVLFARDGRAVVTDFGIARALSAAPSGPSRQVLLGTPAYFSPEQARGLALDGRSDLYSLGVTLYRAATGVVPFGGDDWYVVMRQHVEETAPPPSSVNRDLGARFDAVLRRALEKDPAARYPTGDALADALDALRGAASNRLNTTEIPRIAAARPAPPRPRSWGRVAAALAGSSVLVLGARILAVRGSPERVPSGAPPARVAAGIIASPDSSFGVGGSSVAGVRPDSSGAIAGRSRVPRAVDDSARSRFGRDRTSTVIGDSTSRATQAVPASGSSARVATRPASRTNASGTLLVTAPADADIYVNDEPVGRGTWRSGQLPVGRYNVRASLGGLPGCPSAETNVEVDVTASARRTVTLEPLACGRLVLEFAATSAPHYRLVPVRGGPTREGVLPVGTPIVLPDGLYRLTVEASACAPYEDAQLPVVAGKTRRESRTLICQ